VIIVKEIGNNFIFNYLGFSLGNNTVSNIPLNFYFCSTATMVAISTSSFQLGTALNVKLLNLQHFLLVHN